MPDHANPSAAAPSIDGARTTRLRIDRWLCNARFFKTRGLAVAAIENGRIDINGVRAKAAKWVTTGDFLRIQRPPYVQEVEVLDAVARRVGASIAQGLYRETAASVAARTMALAS